MKFAIPVIAMAVWLGAPAAATLLTFDEPGSGPVAQFHATYAQGGLTFTTPYQAAVWLPGIDPEHLARNGASNGTNVFINGYSTLTITSSNGADFRFDGLDYAQGLYSSNSTDPLTITLNLAGGGETVIDLTSTYTFQTLAIGPVTVTSVVLGATSGYLSIDNLSFSLVPEPGAWLLMLSGFGLLGLSLRQRRAAA